MRNIGDMTGPVWSCDSTIRSCDTCVMISVPPGVKSEMYTTATWCVEWELYTTDRIWHSGLMVFSCCLLCSCWRICINHDVCDDVYHDVIMTYMYQSSSIVKHRSLGCWTCIACVVPFKHFKSFSNFKFNLAFFHEIAFFGDSIDIPVFATKTILELSNYSDYFVS